MAKHVSPLELKDADLTDPVEIVNKSVAELTKTKVNDRIRRRREPNRLTPRKLTPRRSEPPRQARSAKMQRPGAGNCCERRRQEA